MKAVSAALAVALTLPAGASAQAPVTGSASAMIDLIGRPDAGAEGRDADLELRARVLVERRQDLGEHVRLRLSGYVEGLVADRQQASASRDLIARPQELYAEFVSTRADVRVGYSRIVWGRLDELQPTDVVNPVDLARFFLEGRAEARLPVALARARVFLPASTTLEAVVVPQFRRGRFDQLDEPTSTFNLFNDLSLGTKGSDPFVPLTPKRAEPAAGWGNLQGGARVQTTTGRVDWGVSVYRGFRSFGVLAVGPAALTETYPRFTMLGADFETARGEWGLRGEAAAFVDDAFQATDIPRATSGRSIEAGLGADRKAGDFRVSGNVLVRRRSPDEPSASIDRSDVNLIAAVDRSFSRETRRLQVFGVYDPTEATSFLRAIFTVKLTDLLSIEGSGGWFAGVGPDTLGRFTDRDFAYVKVRRDF